MIGTGTEVRAKTALLDVELFDEGPRDAPVVLLLHGWPDDPSTWTAVSPTLNAAGLRTVTPSLRGFGGTRFRDGATPRTGNSETEVRTRRTRLWPVGQPALGRHHDSFLPAALGRRRA